LSPWGIGLNSEISGELLTGKLRPPPAVTRDLDRAMESAVLTGRGYTRVLRVAWTLADLAGLERPDRDAVSTALTFRQQVKAA
jgi:magnesium chelatase family protein